MNFLQDIAVLNYSELGHILDWTAPDWTTELYISWTDKIWWDLAERLERLHVNAKSRTSPGFDPSVLRHSEIWGAADEAVLNKYDKLRNRQPMNFLTGHIYSYLIFSRFACTLRTESFLTTLQCAELSRTTLKTSIIILKNSYTGISTMQFKNLYLHLYGILFLQTIP